MMAKKIIVALLAVISAVFFALGCNHSATVSLDQSELTLVTGGTATLEATVEVPGVSTAPARKLASLEKDAAAFRLYQSHDGT